MNNRIHYNFIEIVNNFMFEGQFVDVKPYGFGHINDTFLACFKNPDGTEQRYILQRINHQIFKDPVKLMQNIHGVTVFLRNKILESGGNPERETLNLIPSKTGQCYYMSPDGNYWRGYIFIEDAQTYQVVENLHHFYNAGKAFGKFQSLLSSYPASTLYETIPDFHNTEKRLKDFREVVCRNPANRVADVHKEIEFVEKRASEASILVDILEKGQLPLRVTHNDTKFNNVMIDNKTGAGICVIDLDTVMPGLSLYDFGDSIRSGANPAAEDEKDITKVCMDLELFEYFTKGYLEAARDFLTPTELEYLPFSTKIMTYECGMRFLTDYLNGDTYFKVHRDGHNLDRARTQFKMVEDMESKFEQMRDIIKKYS